MSHYLYIISSQSNSALYIGVTHDLARRIHEHKNHLISGFTEKYNFCKLVHVEQYSLMMDAVARKKN